MESHTQAWRTWTRRLFVALTLASAGPLVAAPHPRLVSVDAAKCSLCHGKLTRGFEVVHAPVADDCTACHTISVADTATTVELSTSEPGLCLLCHDGFKPAAAGELTAPHAPVTESCLSCHHVHASQYAKLLQSEEKELCAGCHDAAGLRTAHGVPVERANCSSCHDSHGSSSAKLLRGSVLHAPFEGASCEGCHRVGRGTKIRVRAEGSALCFACHSDLEQSFAQGRPHGAVARGLCTGCHDPHMASEPKLLHAKGSALCFSCHPEIERKVTADGAHAAAVEACDGCHLPHVAARANLLADEPTALCLSCHDGADEALRAKHLGADLSTVDCLDCHDPHGSTAPKLVAQGSVHPPFLEDCSSCHQGTAGALTEGGGKALCFACHSDIEETIAGATVPHAAMEGAECVDCHSPHASPNRALLKAAGGDVCTGCHDAQARGPGQFGHQIIAWAGCQSCHEPHGGSSAKLLKASGNELCAGCHLAGAVKPRADGSVELPGGIVLTGERAARIKTVDLDATRTKNHPIAGHPVSGVPQRKGRSKVVESVTSMSCLSCHVPHAAGSQELFAFGAKSTFELCTGCHPK